MRIKVLVIFSLLNMSLLGYNIYGQTSLTDLVNYSLEHSRDVRKYDLQLKEANYMRKEAIGYGLPQVEASASYSKMMLPEMGFSDTTMLAPILDQIINDGAGKQPSKDNIFKMLDGLSGMDALYSTSAGIQVTQLIYSQSYWVGIKTAKKVEELYSILKSKNEEDVIAEVATGYYQTGSLMLQLQTINKSIQNLKDIYRIVELNYKNDLVKETTVNRLKVTISNLEVTSQTIKNGIDIQLNYLKALAGMPSDSLLRIDTASFVNNFQNNEVNVAFNIENVPSYQALLKQSEVSGQQVKLAKAKYYPTLAAYGQFNYSSYSTASDINIDNMNNMNTIGLSFSMPIFTSGVNHSKVKQAQLKQAQLKEDISQTKDLLIVSYNNAFLEYVTSKEMVAAQKENCELAQKVYNQTSLQYQEGMASMADLLNVNSDFLQAENSYNQQILKCKTSEIKMLKASGNLKSMVNKK